MPCLAHPNADSELWALWEWTLYFSGFNSYQVAPPRQSGPSHGCTQCQPADQMCETLRITRFVSLWVKGLCKVEAMGPLRSREKQGRVVSFGECINGVRKENWEKCNRIRAQGKLLKSTQQEQDKKIILELLQNAFCWWDSVIIIQVAVFFVFIPSIMNKLTQFWFRFGLGDEVFSFFHEEKMKQVGKM